MNTHLWNDPGSSSDELFQVHQIEADLEQSRGYSLSIALRFRVCLIYTLHQTQPTGEEHLSQPAIHARIMMNLASQEFVQWLDENDPMSLLRAK